jgi:hypothetical protein
MKITQIVFNDRLTKVRSQFKYLLKPLAGKDLGIFCLTDKCGAFLIF